VKETITLSRATWSNRYSQCLSGSAGGRFVHSERVFRVEWNVFEGETFLYRVDGWQPDGSGYSDREWGGGMSFKETFKGLLLEFLRRQGIEATEVTQWDDDCDAYTTGYDSYEYTEKEFSVDIYYRTAGMKRRVSLWEGDEDRVYTYDYNFSKLLEGLIAIAEELDANPSR